MRRRWLLLSLVLLACRAVTGLRPQPVSPLAAPSPTAGLPAATPVSAPAWQPAMGKDAAGGYSLQVHPDGPLFSGDLISFAVVAPSLIDEQAERVSILVDPPVGPSWEAALTPFGIGGRLQATFQWAWDTGGLTPGEYMLHIVIQPAGLAWREPLLLLPAADRPANERGAVWAEKQIACCQVWYITGTAAERDLPELLPLIEIQAQSAASSLGIPLDEPISLVLLPRLLGHGGFAIDEIYVSYLDRMSTAGDPALVVQHEIIHLLDGRVERELRPTILAEGLAVYLVGGHYKTEPLFPRAAALVEAGGYLPLGPLTDTFYLSQHETGYLEAGALVEYMVNTWGLEAVLDFYHAIQPDPSGSQARAIDQALQAHFGLTYTALEARFLGALEMYPVNPDLLEDVHLTIRLYDTLRRYQLALDPSAYFLSAWLPDIDEIPDRGLVADYLRKPEGVENIALETMLAAAGGHLQAGRYLQAGQLLSAANQALAGIEAGEQEPFAASALSGDYLALVGILQGQGYQVQRINLAGDAAQVWVYNGEETLEEIELARSADQAWVMLSLAD